MAFLIIENLSHPKIQIQSLERRFCTGTIGERGASCTHIVVWSSIQRNSLHGSSQWKLQYGIHSVRLSECKKLFMRAFLWHQISVIKCPFRLNSLLCVLALQLYMLWNFVLFHVRRYREKHSKVKMDKQLKIQQKRRKHVNDDVSS